MESWISRKKARNLPTHPIRESNAKKKGREGGKKSWWPECVDRRKSRQGMKGLIKGAGCSSAKYTCDDMAAHWPIRAWLVHPGWCDIAISPSGKWWHHKTGRQKKIKQRELKAQSFMMTDYVQWEGKWIKWLWRDDNITLLYRSSTVNLSYVNITAINSLELGNHPPC